MKVLKILVLILFPFSFVFSQQNSGYDSQLADSLGADELGMTSYVLVILKTGTNDIKDEKLRSEYFKSHFENMTTMTKSGKLVVAGPIEKNGKQYRGIFILKVADFVEAETLLQNDLTVRERIFDVEMYKWYGSAALPMYLPYHEKVQKKKLE